VQVVGPDRRVSLDDRQALPYTQAVLMESMRMASLVPAGLAHSVDQDLHFAGYTFPKVI
jgi:cytochrome P450